MLITRPEILRRLGPASINWDFEEKRRVRTRGGRIRSLVCVWVRRHLIEDFENFDVPESYEKVHLTIWGTASVGEPEDTATERAVSYGLMMFGLLPELAKAHGLDEVIDRLGPVCLDWEFAAVKTFQPEPRRVRCEVVLTCNLSRLSYDGRGEGEVKRVETGEVDVRTSYPEDEALFAAIRNCCKWMALLPDDEDVKHDTKIPVSKRPVRLLTKVVGMLMSIFTVKL
jgi:hypothetical protein